MRKLRLSRRTMLRGTVAGGTVALALPPLEAMACIGLGIRSLSMSAPSVGAVRAMVRSLDCATTGRFVRSLLALPDRSLRGRLRAFARDHRVDA